MTEKLLIEIRKVEGMDNKINDFMYVYMYHLEQYLLSKKETLDTISFQSDEANTDRPLKEYLKMITATRFYHS